MKDDHPTDPYDPDLYEEPELYEQLEAEFAYPIPAPPAEAPVDEHLPKFTSRLERGVHVLSIVETNVLDAYEVERLGDDIYEFLEALDAPKVIIDLSNIDHLSSAGLGMLIALRAVVEREGGVLCIANISADLRSVLSMTRLNKVIRMYESLEEALGCLA